MNSLAAPFWDRVDASGDCWEWTLSGAGNAEPVFGVVEDE